MGAGVRGHDQEITNHFVASGCGREPGAPRHNRTGLKAVEGVLLGIESILLARAVIFGQRMVSACTVGDPCACRELPGRSRRIQVG
jgi:hypothetical protein